MENKKGYIITIIVMFLIIVGLGGFIALERSVLKKSESSTITTIGENEINLNSFYQVADIMNKFDNAFNDNNSKYVGYPYSEKKITAEKFDFDAALFLSTYSELFATNTEQTIPEGKIKSNFETIFGNNLKYESKSINAGDTYKITYSKDNANYTYTLAPTKAPYTSGYVAKNINTKLEEEKIVVTRKVFYVEYEQTLDNTTPTVATIYKDASKAQRIGQVNLRKGVLSDSEILAKFSSKMNTYNMIFKHVKDAEYNFYMIEKIK